MDLLYGRPCCVKEVAPEVYIDGTAEADKGGRKIGPAAAGEPVGAEDKGAEDGPELLDGCPLYPSDAADELLCV